VRRHAADIDLAIAAALLFLGTGCSSSSSPATSGGSTDGGASAEAGAAGRTSAACGALPILGDFSGEHGPIPDTCTSCVNTQCCSQAMACAADAQCKAWKDCQEAAGTYAAAINGSGTTCKVPTGSSLQLNGAFNTCRAKCDACLDLRCVGKPFPTPSESSFAFHLTTTNYSAGTPLAGVNVKVCALSDTSCATPLQTGATAQDGTIDLMGPSAGGGLGYYMMFADGGAAPTSTFLRVTDFTTALSAKVPALTFSDGLLDPNTWSLLRGQFNLPADPGMRSRLSVTAYSCGFVNLQGATVTSSAADSSTHFAYVANGIPSTTATQTDTTGIAAWEDHPAGPTTITVTKAGQTLATANVNVPPGMVVVVGLGAGP
jgi:hypothetical protein